MKTIVNNTYTLIAQTKDGKQPRTYTVLEDNGDMLKLRCHETNRVGDFQKEPFLKKATQVETPKDKPADKPKPSASKPKDKPATSGKNDGRAKTAKEIGDIVDKWITSFKEEAKGNGMTVEVKTWEKIPTCRALKVDGVTWFEIYFSSRGARLCAKSKLIPEAIRPEGANIIKNGLDLTIPTIARESIVKDLTKYADACRKSIAAAKKAKDKPAK